MEKTQNSPTPNGNTRADYFLNHTWLATTLNGATVLTLASTQEEIDAFHESEGYILVDGQWTFPQPELDENGLQITS